MNVVARLAVVLALPLVSSQLTAASLNIPEAPFGSRIVSLHNQLRGEAGVRPMMWDAQLAADAAAYASQLASTGQWGHSSPGQRPGEGENLWMGTRGAFDLDHMIGAWGSEGRVFRAGAFPTVSATGKWSDVGHYTQIIWPSTIRVGCAVRSSASFDYLVCRYSPAGNVIGSRVP